MEQCGIVDRVTVEVEDGTIVLRPPKPRPREGWAEAAKRMAKAHLDRVGLDFPNQFDEREWEW
jgi:antitoxin MazE